MARIFEIPDPAVVILVGTSSSGKSTFARKHFRPTEILSSDWLRAVVCDDENDQSATKDAFETLYYIAAKRLRNRKLCLIDATNVRKEDRHGYVELAQTFQVPSVAIVFLLDKGILLSRHQTRSDRDFGEHVLHTQWEQLQRDIAGLEGEGFRLIYYLNCPEEVEQVQIVRKPEPLI